MLFTYSLLVLQVMLNGKAQAITYHDPEWPINSQIILFVLSHITLPTSGSSVAIYPISPFTELSAIDRSQLAFIRQYNRAKRSGAGGSGDILNSLKTSIATGLKSKIGSLAKSSASASGHFSKSIGNHLSHLGGGGHHSAHPTYYHDHNEHDDAHMKAFDLWSLKKHIFRTLFQAAKAIKGGVIAIKGQLIKGGGHLISAKGKLITGGGEALSNIGKNIASSAFMIVPHESHDSHEDHGPEHVEYEPHPATYGHATSHDPELYHGAPSAPGPEYGHPSGSGYHNSQYEGKHHNGVDGIVILKKIPKQLEHIEHGLTEHGHRQTEHELHTPTFKPLSNNVMYSVLPSVQHFVGSMFSASTGSHENEVSHEHHAEYNTHPVNSHNEHDQYIQHSQPSVKTQSVANSVNEPEKLPRPTATNYGIPTGPTLKYLEYFNSQANTVPLKTPQQMFVTPMPEQLNLNYEHNVQPAHHASNQNIQTNEQNNLQRYLQQYIQTMREKHPQNNPQKHQTYKVIPSNSNTNTQIYHANPSNIQENTYHNSHIPAEFLTQYPQSIQELQHLQDPRNLGADIKLVPTPYSQVIPTKMIINYPDPTELSEKYLQDSIQQSGRHLFKKTSSRLQKKKPNIDIIRSVAFELGPNGPMKIYD